MQKACLCVFVSLSLAACTEPGGQPGRGVLQGGAINKSDIGTAAGAIGGGILGSTIGGGAGQTAATIGGVLLGGMLGRSVGSSLDNADRAAYERASERAFQTGNSTSWRSQKTGNYGSIRPTGAYVDDYGNYCREYNQTIYIDGERQSGHGTACREQDGSWRITD